MKTTYKLHTNCIIKGIPKNLVVGARTQVEDIGEVNRSKKATVNHLWEEGRGYPVCILYMRISISHRRGLES